MALDTNPNLHGIVIFFKFKIKFFPFVNQWNASVSLALGQLLSNYMDSDILYIYAINHLLFYITNNTNWSCERIKCVCVCEKGRFADDDVVVLVKIFFIATTYAMWIPLQAIIKLL